MQIGVGIGIPLTVASGGASAVSGAALLAAGYAQAFALDFTDDTWLADTGFYGSAFIKDTGTPANDYDSSPTLTASSLLTYTAPSLKMTMGPSGTLRFQAHNLNTNSENFQGNTQVYAANSSVSGNVVSITGVDGYNFRRAPHTTIVGATYALSGTVICSTSATVGVRITSAGGATYAQTAISCSAGVAAAFSLSFTATFADQPVYGIEQRAATIPGASDLTGETVTINYCHLRRTPSDSTYLATTSAARYALPLEWDSAGNALGLLVEEARTNLLTYSEQLDNAAWTKSNATVSANAAAAPSGETVADLFVPSSGSALHYISPANATYTSGTAYTFSFFAKPGSRRYLLFTVGSTAFSNQYAVYDLTGGTVTESSGTLTASMTETVEGYYRCIFTATAGANAADSVFFISSDSATPGTRVPNSTGDGASGYYIWGAELEPGAFPTSYIPTLGSTVTRAADNISKATSGFPYGATQSIYIVANTSPVAAASRSCIYFDLGASENSRVKIREASNQMLAEVQDSSGAAIAAMAGAAVAASTTFKAAMAVALDDMSFVRGGSVINTDNAGTPGGTATTLHVGGNYAGGAKINGHIKQILYVPERIANAALQTLTWA